MYEVWSNNTEKKNASEIYTQQMKVEVTLNYFIRSLS